MFNSLVIVGLLAYLSCIVSFHLSRPTLGSRICGRLRISLREKESDDDSYGRPILVPYDTVPKDDKELFAKPRVIVKPSKEPVQEVAKEVVSRDDAQPTGYDTPDDEPADDWLPSDLAPSNDPMIVKIFKDLYIGSPYDSSSRQQARYVIKNITGIVVAIGLIFTFIWYAFPGKFISYQGDTDLTSRYRTSSTDGGLDAELNTDLVSPDDFEYFNDFSEYKRSLSSPPTASDD